MPRAAISHIALADGTQRRGEIEEEQNRAARLFWSSCSFFFASLEVSGKITYCFRFDCLLALFLLFKVNSAALPLSIMFFVRQAFIFLFSFFSMQFFAKKTCFFLAQFLNERRKTALRTIKKQFSRSHYTNIPACWVILIASMRSDRPKKKSSTMRKV